ncbi:hypothetical protein M5X00_22550 [Paenibacillus alvei]|uniref:hypothetical protein n=1 Tax=Paenibacillus alvei TaxID=44250 RepID=UPI00227E0BE7|nr:hypothetical protein [Paenibacillus alvei]MCY9707816.1 hypothetical protein [Paenibacillus alvei]MCY9757028.1 hypothetical protein [Paenibacillus alvei]
MRIGKYASICSLLHYPFGSDCALGGQASPLSNTAGPMLRDGLTDVLSNAKDSALPYRFEPNTLL